MPKLSKEEYLEKVRSGEYVQINDWHKKEIILVKVAKSKHLEIFNVMAEGRKDNG